MPIAVINTEETHRKELKSLPEAFVVLRRLSYGDWLTRQSLAMNMTLEQDAAKDTKAAISMSQRAVAEWEFQECIVEHNLMSAPDVLLDFRSKSALKMLDPKVGTEVAAYISELHDFDAELPK